MLTPSLAAPDPAATLAFRRRVADLQRAVAGAAQVLTETENQLRLLRQAIDQTPAADLALRREIAAHEARLRELRTAMSGDRVVASRQESVPPGIQNRVQNAVANLWSPTIGPTNTQRRSYEIAAQEFADWLPKLRQLVDVDLKALFARAEAAGAPWTPGRIPDWRP